MYIAVNRKKRIFRCWVGVLVHNNEFSHKKVLYQSHPLKVLGIGKSAALLTIHLFPNSSSLTCGVCNGTVSGKFHLNTENQPLHSTKNIATE
jgi:hypothetical protein